MIENQLKRSLNLPLLTLYGLGTILGAGIYVLIGEVAGLAGLYAPMAFLLSAIIATFTGLSYGQLSSRYPRSAGEALYVNEAFSIPSLSTLVGWCVIATGVVSSATLVNGFVGYLSVFITLPSALVVSITVFTITLIACWGITESVTLAAVITGIEILGLIIVLVALNGEFSTLPGRWGELMPPIGTSGSADIWLGIMLGAFLAFYAFIGFEDIVNVAEEVINPQRTLPIAIILSLAIATVFYMLIAVVAVLSLPLEQLSSSDSPMVALLAKEHPTLAKCIGIISLIAIINGALVQVIMGSRMLYGMGCQKLAPHFFSLILEKTQTPITATLTIGLIIWLLALAFPLVTLAKITSFIIIVIFSLVNFSLAFICYKETNKWYKKDTLIPILGGALCLFLLSMQIFL